jgi:predicted CXXCH cytochrome family protein
MKWWPFVAVVLAAEVVLVPAPARPDKATEKRFVGSEACKDCHPSQYEAFSGHAKKSQSYKAVQKLAKRLTPEELKGCYQCHTTGYGQPGGFESIQATPQLANAGCEICHGAGSAHAASSARSEIVRRPKIEVCDGCHTATRVKAFNYRPLRYAGAH